MLRANLRDLRTEAGEHYADILLSLYQRQLKKLREEQEVDRAEVEAVQIAAAATRADEQVDQAETGAPEVSAAANEPDPRVDQGNGNPDRPEAAHPANGAASSKGQKDANPTGQVDKSALPINTPRRVRDKLLTQPSRHTFAPPHGRFLLRR